MIIKNESLLESFRTGGLCEWCGAKCKQREGAHIYSRGTGRVDARWNLVSLGSSLTFQCPCHRNSHAGSKPYRGDLLAIAAKREGTSADAITEAVHALRRLDKHSSLERIDAWLGTLSPAAASLVKPLVTKEAA